jgi:hypothetical protein
VKKSRELDTLAGFLFYAIRGVWSLRMALTHLLLSGKASFPKQRMDWPAEQTVFNPTSECDRYQAYLSAARVLRSV